MDTPASSIPRSGRITELCSTEVVTTWSPGLSIPLIAWFSATVAFPANTNRELSLAPNVSASLSRAEKRSLAERRDRMWPERPGFPARRIAEATASATPLGLGSEVAALSR
jgi:hypothetical protein